MTNITQQEFHQLASYIEIHFGIHLKDEKQSLLVGRLQHVLTDLGFQTFTQYYEYLVKDKTGQAGPTLVDKITTNHTYFMRETGHFYYFRDVVLPYLKSTVHDKDLRVWCAASSSGEEAYTIAMLIDEFFSKEKMFWDTKILATDISGNVLEKAKKGVYSKEQIAPLPAIWKSQYFKQYTDNSYVVTERMKHEVLYRKFNLMEEIYPFKKKFHVIFCRNVMIYFDLPTKDAVIQKLYDSLQPGGYLFIGHSESINRETSAFKYISPAIYRKA